MHKKIIHKEVMYKEILHVKITIYARRSNTMYSFIYLPVFTMGNLFSIAYFQWGPQKHIKYTSNYIQEIK